jgi:hypothetical protein
MSVVTLRELNPESTRIGEIEDFELVETDFHYPLLARWRYRGQPPTAKKVWAVASHLLVYCQSPDDDKMARQAFVDALGGKPLQFRDLRRRNGTAFRVGPIPSTPAFRFLTETGSVLGTLQSLRERFRGTTVRVKPDFLCCLDALPEGVDFAHQKDTMERIAAPQAWSRQTGSRGVVVAVVDTGIDHRHPDLQRNLLRDLEGDVTGWNFLSGTADSDDDHWHGTYCAGLVGAVGEDGTGMTGVNWRVSLMPVKAFSAAGFATSTHAAAAITFAADHGADVILCAWGTPGDSEEIADAIAYADGKGALVVAAAGNSPVALEDVPHYPASFAPRTPNLISVSASDGEDRPLEEAGFSGTQVHLSAPGKRVYSTFPTRLQPYLPYHISDGTSAAAALVAGACALLKAHAASAQRPYSHRQILEAILEGVDKPPELAGRSTTGGRLNLDKALSALDESMAPPTSRPHTRKPTTSRPHTRKPTTSKPKVRKLKRAGKP